MNKDSLKYKHIHFKLFEQKAKTKVYMCHNNNSNDSLGIVKWYPAWRQYCYCPTNQSVYSNGCLDDIKDFITQLMEERKYHCFSYMIFLLLLGENQLN